jgi:hypothetical protein
MIQSAICDSAKEDFLRGIHLPGDKYKIALYLEGAELNAKTKEYTPKNEASGEGYSAGGQNLSDPIIGIKNGSAVLTFKSPVKWENASIEARGAMVYNATKSNKAVAVFLFEKNAVSSNGPFSVNIPNEGAIILS